MKALKENWKLALAAIMLRLWGQILRRLFVPVNELPEVAFCPTCGTAIDVEDDSGSG